MFQSYMDGDSDHARMRKSIWNRQDMVHVYISKLMQKLRANEGSPVDVLRWFDCLGADISSRIVFGGSFHVV